MLIGTIERRGGSFLKAPDRTVASRRRRRFCWITWCSSCGGKTTFCVWTISITPRRIRWLTKRSIDAATPPGGRGDPHRDLAVRLPVALKTLSFVPLGGLSLADAHNLLAARQVTLKPDLLAELHQRTDGNAELLTLAAYALRRNQHPEQIVKRLADEDDVETFLLKKVDEGLTTDERQAISGVAALLGYPGTRDAIEATLAGGSLKRTLQATWPTASCLREQEGPPRPGVSDPCHCPGVLL